LHLNARIIEEEIAHIIEEIVEGVEDNNANAYQNKINTV
jgi:hypothetical protein